MALYSFFEAYLRGDQTARALLENGLAAENADITVQFDTGDQ